MTARLQLILLAIVAVVGTADCIWAHGFDIDAKSYGLLALIAAGVAGAGQFYQHIRKDERLAAMLTGTAFLISCSACFSVLNYLLLTKAGARIDVALAAADRAVGFDWPSVMAFMADHPLANFVLQIAYISILPQMALLVIAIGILGKRPERIYSLGLAVAIGAALTLAVWTIAPSFGAFSVYELAPGVARRLVVALDGRYARELIDLLANGPGRIAPVSAKGLIGFPSYHAVMGLLVMWYARDLPYLRWGAFGLNALLLVATPIQGGHHLMDVAGGFAVAALSVWCADSAARWAARHRAGFALETTTAGA